MDVLVLKEFDSLFFLVILKSGFRQLVFEELNFFFVFVDLLETSIGHVGEMTH